MRALRRLLIALLLPATGFSCGDATGEDVLPLVDWIPRICDDCGRVDPGATRYVHVDSIIGGGAARVAIVYYWRAAIAPNDAVVPGPISRRRIRLDAGLIN